jgi:hypothetical protein
MRITIEIDDDGYDALAQAVEEYGFSTDPGGANEGERGEAVYAQASQTLASIRHAMLDAS